MDVAHSKHERGRRITQTFGQNLKYEGPFWIRKHRWKDDKIQRDSKRWTQFRKSMFPN